MTPRTHRCIAVGVVALLIALGIGVVRARTTPTHFPPIVTSVHGTPAVLWWGNSPYNSVQIRVTSTDGQIRTWRDILVKQLNQASDPNGRSGDCYTVEFGVTRTEDLAGLFIPLTLGQEIGCLTS